MLLVEFLGLEPGELCLVQYPMLCSFDYLLSILLLLEVCLCKRCLP